MVRLRASIGVGALSVFLPLSHYGVLNGHGQSTKPPQQPLYLPDPTPRQRDPHSEFGDSPNERTLVEQRTALARQRSRSQVLADTREILLLAEQLRSHMAHPDGSPPAPLDRMAAQKIEKLAKNVKSTMQLQ